MSELDIRRYLLDTDTDPKNYFTSLVAKAREKDIIKEAEYAMIQEELLLILADQTFKFNNRQSTSISVANAKGLLNSIAYTVGIQLKTFPSPDAAVMALRRDSVKNLFNAGNKIVHQKTEKSRSIQKHLLTHLFKTKNKFIRSCLEDDINDFFSAYSPDYFAYGDDLWFAYEPYTGFPNLAGIEFIEQYLRDAEAENSFCLLFDSEDIHHLLCGVSADYALAPINIFEHVILSAIGLVLNDRSPVTLDLSATDVFNIYDIFAGKDSDEIKEVIVSACEKLMFYLNIPENVRSYILRSIPKLSAAVESALKREILDKIFVRPAYPENSAFITLAKQPRMDNADYKMLTAKLLVTVDSEEKVSLILSSVKSAEDLTDAVNDGELTKDEITSLVERLDYKEFVILYAKNISAAFSSRENDVILFEALDKRRNELSDDEKKQFDSIVKALKQ